MFITQPTNIDYLITDVRLHVGDVDGTRFSDTLIRTALVNGIKFLQHYWSTRYLVYSGAAMYVQPQPATVTSGYIYVALPDGYAEIQDGISDNDIFKNPALEFSDVGLAPISQADEAIIVISATLMLCKSLLTSSSLTFVNWSDGEYSYSNVAASQVLSKIFASALDDFNNFFKSKRGKPLRRDFPEFVI